MQPLPPIVRVNQTLELRFPGWWAANKAAAPPQDVISASETLNNNEFSEFFLSAGWFLFPQGLKEFFEEWEKDAEVCYQLKFRIMLGHESN